jgi:two-component system, LuxR family, response regulator FixJ
MAAPILSIVDDDEAVRESIGSLVRSAGYRTLLFESARAFLDAGGAHATDCVIVDFYMQGLNGLGLQRLLKDMNHSNPVILISAHHDEIRAAALDLGAVAVLGKPFNDDALLAAIRAALESSERQR